MCKRGIMGVEAAVTAPRPLFLSLTLIMGLYGLGTASSDINWSLDSFLTATVQNTGDDFLPEARGCTATLFESPDAQVRLRALEAWAQQEAIRSDDFLRHALDDPDEQVRARALQLIEEASVREQEELKKRE
jgi:hypothetical protein